ncbi:MAG: BatA and WFA domain-containing protein [Anaerolineae bacterium]|nr:BatA and WFA domain-containing protein [Anaerolineae bacterium]
MSFLTPLALALSALAIPIVLLYMLRLRRTEMPISSTFLWQQLIRDREANAPWQRLRLSWLLLLQLLILAALVIALARPFTEVKTITTGRIVLLLDASASMKAKDVEPSRFAAAREIGLDLVDTLGADDTMTLIQVGNVPEVLAAASRDKLVLRKALEDASPSDVSADWFAAMTLAAAGAIGVDELKVVIVTDGGLPGNLPAVPGDVRFVQVGESGSNLAISALATSALPGRDPQVFARISNYGETDTDVILDITLDDDETFFTARRYTVPADSYVDIFDLDLPASFDALTAQLTLPRNAAMPDYLVSDNLAYAVQDPSGAGRVLLMTEDNIFVEQIFRSLRGVELYLIEPGTNLPRDQYDLYVFDSWLPTDLPTGGDLLIINPPRGLNFFQLGGEIEPRGSITVNSDDPRMRNLASYMEAIFVDKMRTLGDIEWGTVLAEIDGNPLVITGEVDEQQVVILPFDARYPNTDLVLQPAWPILIAELASWFSPPRITDTAESLSPGSPVTVRFIENAEEAIVTLPNGRTVMLEPESSEVVFADTLQSGLYRVDLRKDGETFRSEQFAVNLFDAAESDIEPQANVQIGTSTIAEAAREETGRREFWPWVIGAGLAVIMVEWLVYHRALQRRPAVTLAGLHGSGSAQPGGWRARFSTRINRLLRRPSARRTTRRGSNRATMRRRY